MPKPLSCIASLFFIPVLLADASLAADLLHQQMFVGQRSSMIFSDNALGFADNFTHPKLSPGAIDQIHTLSAQSLANIRPLSDAPSARWRIVSREEWFDGDERAAAGLTGITIDLLPSLNGYGDVMNAFRLAVRIRDSRQFKRTRFLIEDGKDWDKLNSLYPQFPAYSDSTDAIEFSGIIFINGARVSPGSILQESKIAIVSSLMSKRKDPTERPREALINIYVQEYDLSQQLKGRFAEVARVTFDDGTEAPENKWLIDTHGQAHFVLPAGFSSDAGITLLGQIEATLPRSEIIEELRHTLDLSSIPFDPNEAPWGFAYYDNFEHFREKVEKPLLEAFQRGNFHLEKALIFDMSPDDTLMHFHEHEAWYEPPFSHLVMSPNNRKGVFIRGSVHPNIIIIHSRFPHKVYSSIIAQADLPILVRGDVTISEAISLDKLWQYQASPWKGRVISSARDVAIRYLEVDEAAKVLGLWGFESHLADDEKLWEYFVHNRDLICDFYTETKDATSSMEVRYGLLKKRLLSAGTKEPKLLDSNHIWHYYNAASRESPEEQRFILRDGLIFEATAFDSVERKYRDRLYWDVAYQKALHKFNQAVRQHKDLPTYLLAMLPGAVDRYDSEHIKPAMQNQQRKRRRLSARQALDSAS